MSKENQCSPACAWVENPAASPKPEAAQPAEFKGFAAKNLPEPTRYGDWEVGGRCSDF